MSRVGTRRALLFRAAPVLAALVLAGCPGEATIERKGWLEAMECVEIQRSHNACREPKRSDAPYVAGWERAIACMDREHRLAACREPQPRQ